MTERKKGLQPKPWTYGPKAGTRTAFAQGRAARISVNVLNIKPRLWKKTMKAIINDGQEKFNGRNQRLVYSEHCRECWELAEDRIYY